MVRDSQPQRLHPTLHGKDMLRVAGKLLHPGTHDDYDLMVIALNGCDGMPSIMSLR